MHSAVLRPFIAESNGGSRTRLRLGSSNAVETIISDREHNSHQDKEDVMALLEIIRPEFECHGHHRHFSPSPSHAIGPVLVEFAEIPRQPGSKCNRASCVTAHPEEEK
jgi:hypothetical protein